MSVDVDAVVGWMRREVNESNPVLLEPTQAAALLDGLDAARAAANESQGKAAQWQAAAEAYRDMVTELSKSPHREGGA